MRTWQRSWLKDLKATTFFASAHIDSDDFVHDNLTIVPVFNNKASVIAFKNGVTILLAYAHGISTLVGADSERAISLDILLNMCHACDIQCVAV